MRLDVDGAFGHRRRCVRNQLHVCHLPAKIGPSEQRTRGKVALTRPPCTVGKMQSDCT